MLLFLLIVLSVSCVGIDGAKPGPISHKLDEIYSSLKCVVTIVEDLIPEFNSFIPCCTVWIMTDYFGSLVLKKCTIQDYHTINNMTNILMPDFKKECSEYPPNTFACKLLIIVPITLAVLIFVLLVGSITYAIILRVRLERIKKEYETSSEESDTKEKLIADQDDAQNKQKENFV